MVSSASVSRRVDATSTPLGAARLGTHERAVLTVLVAHSGRVVSRRELSRQAGMADLSERRCDSVLVILRRRLGQGAIRTVRSRGWMLERAAAAVAESLL